MNGFEWKGRNWLTILGLVLLASFGVGSLFFGIFLLFEDYIGLIFIGIFLGILAPVWYCKRAFAPKRLVLDNDRVVFYRGKTAVLDARWDEITALDYHTGMLAGNAEIRIQIGFREILIGEEMDIPFRQMERIYPMMKRAWEGSTGIEVEPEIIRPRGR